MKRGTVAVVVVLLMLALSSVSLAFVRDIPETLVVRSTFEVVLQDRGRPIIGMDVFVQRYNSSEKWETVKAALTDVAGRARFTDVPTGDFVVATHGASGNDSRAIQITEDPRRKAVPQIELAWPAKKVIVARSFEGVLTSLPTHETPSEALRAVKLDVLEAHSASLEASLVSDEQGELALKTLPPGMYFLRLSRQDRNEDDRIWGWKLEGDVAVEVDPLQRDAPDSIQLELMMTDCGLWYRNANR